MRSLFLILFGHYKQNLIWLPLIQNKSNLIQRSRIVSYFLLPSFDFLIFLVGGRFIFYLILLEGNYIDPVSCVRRFVQTTSRPTVV